MIVSREKCYVCGTISDFLIGDSDVLLREAKCCNCGASIRNSDMSNVIISKLAGKDTSLTEALSELKSYKILSTCSSGVIHNVLRQSPNYKYGEYFDGVISGEYYDNVLCVDLQDIPFPDDYFDLIISEDVLEHVSNTEFTFVEINRVLKLNGQHIFTVPIHENKRTIKRDALKNKVYHGDPIREIGAFVYTDFGNDIELIIDNYGMKTERFLLHRFYDAIDITDIDEEYENYLSLRNDLLRFFKYNSIVLCSTKIKNLPHEKKGGGNMNFTGERYIPGKAFGEIESEHMHRYMALADIVNGKVVLDAACGEGYGTSILSDTAKQVYGIDISEESIEYAKSKYKRDNIKYSQCSIEKLDFEDEFFDVIVSYETIEHVGEDIQENFLKEAKRVLKKDGILIISTPDKQIYSDVPNYKNEYHIREFYFYEFQDFLKKYFKNVYFFNQDFGIFCIIKSYDNYMNRCFKHINAPDINIIGKYIVAICSDAEVRKNDSLLSIYRHQSSNEGKDPVKDNIQVFWDNGEEFSESNSLRVPYEFRDEYQRLKIKLPKKAKGKIRIDIGSVPLALVKVKRVFISTGNEKIISDDINIVEYSNMLLVSSMDDCKTFLTINGDPQFIIDYVLKRVEDDEVYLNLELNASFRDLQEYINIFGKNLNETTVIINNLKQVIKEKELRMEEQQALLREREKKSEEQENQLKDKEKLIEEQENQLKDKKKLIEEQQGRLIESDTKLFKQENILKEYKAIKEKQNELISQMEVEIQRLIDEMQKRESEISNYKDAISDLEGVLSKIRGSISWKITKPLRCLLNKKEE